MAEQKRPSAAVWEDEKAVLRRFLTPVRWVSPPALALLALVLATEPLPPTIEPPASAPVAWSDVAPGPLRQPLGDPPVLRIAGEPTSCNACHGIFPSVDKPPEQLSYHRNIALDHGMNDRCLNCHARDDHERFALHDGSLVGFDDAPLLCAKCHGPTYRDWQVGVHGKTTGSWLRESPDFRRLSCVECHDPHKPAFDPMTPLPAPKTLRMGRPAASGHTVDTEELGPLRRHMQQWRRQDRHAEAAEGPTP